MFMPMGCVLHCSRSGHVHRPHPKRFLSFLSRCLVPVVTHALARDPTARSACGAPVAPQVGLDLACVISWCEVGLFECNPVPLALGVLADPRGPTRERHPTPAVMT